MATSVKVSDNGVLYGGRYRRWRTFVNKRNRSTDITIEDFSSCKRKCHRLGGDDLFLFWRSTSGPRQHYQVRAEKAITAAALISDDVFLRSLSTRRKIYHNSGNHTEAQADWGMAIRWETKHCADAGPRLLSQRHCMD